MKFIGRISGIVSYTDDTHDQFAAHRDEKGNISVSSGIGDTPNSSNAAILEVQADNNWLESMLALISEDLELDPDGSPTKVVNGAAMHFMGRVARDNHTWEDFAVSYEAKTGAFIVNGSGTGNTVGAYSEFDDNIIQSWLESMVGSGNVSTS